MIYENATINFFIDENQPKKPGETPEISIRFNGLIQHKTMCEVIGFIRKIQARDWDESLHVSATFQNIDE